MYFKKNIKKITANINLIKVFFFITFFIISFMLGAYAHKNHFFYTFVKPLVFENLNFIKKQFQGKFQNVEKIYLNIDFENLTELNNRRSYFLEKGALDPNKNNWLDISIIHENFKYDSKIRFKGRDPETHLNPSMRNDNVSYKIKIKKRNKGNILGMREFNLMDLRRRGYLLEWYARKFLQNEGLIFLDYKFINLFINGKDHGIYVMDEAISEATLTRNKRRDSVSVRIDNNFVGSNVDLSITNPSLAGFDNVFFTGEIDTLNETINTKKKELSNKGHFNNNFPISIKEKIILDPNGKRFKNFNLAKRLLSDFRKGKLKTEEVFDIDQLAKGFAASDIFDGWHGLNWTNLSFYFNPISLKLEPIFQDWYNEGSISTGYEELQRSIRYLDVYNYGIFYRNIFSSKKFLEKYVSYLEKYSNNEYFEEFNKKIKKEFNSNLKIIYKSSPYYNFPHDLFLRKIELVKNFLYNYDPIYLDLIKYSKSINSQNNILLELGNKHVLPIIISKIITQNYEGEKFEKNLDLELTPRNLKMFTDRKFDQAPVKYQQANIKVPNFKNFQNITVEFKVVGSSKKFYKSLNNPVESLDRKKLNLNNYFITNIDNSNLDKNKFIEIIGNNYIVKKGTWIIYDDLIIPSSMQLTIPAGTKLILTNKAQIISKSPIIAIGTPLEKILFTSESNIEYAKQKKKETDLKVKSDNLGQCIIILDTDEISIFENVEFNNLRNCNKGPVYSEGSLNVFKSNIRMKNILFTNNKYGDDGINFINTKFELENIKLKNIHADGIDLDYSFGKIKNLSCYNCLNDGIDISNTSLKIENFNANKIFDKAMSIGENSILEAKFIKIENSHIGLAVKDGSIAKVSNISIGGTKYPITTYIKKKEFGNPKIDIETLYLKKNLNPILIEEGSKFKFDDNSHNKLIKVNLFETLYPNAEYRNLQ